MKRRRGVREETYSVLKDPHEIAMECEGRELQIQLKGHRIQRSKVRNVPRLKDRKGSQRSNGQVKRVFMGSISAFLLTPSTFLEEKGSIL